jgi:hypothetical protein
MRINIQSGQVPVQNPNVIPARGGGVIIGSKMKRVSERLDKDGNVIDPRTKQIIRKNTDK